jgi:uncharacterized protein DUF5320
MPRGDKTGPQGLGSMTGRGMGSCTGNENPGNNSSTRTGRGRGRGFFGGFGQGGAKGFGRGTGRFQDQNSETEKNGLEDEVSMLKGQMKILEEQLAKMQDKD